VNSGELHVNFTYSEEYRFMHKIGWFAQQISGIRIIF